MQRKNRNNRGRFSFPVDTSWWFDTNTYLFRKWTETFNTEIYRCKEYYRCSEESVVWSYFPAKFNQSCSDSRDNSVIALFGAFSILACLKQTSESLSIGNIKLFIFRLLEESAAKFSLRFMLTLFSISYGLFLNWLWLNFHAICHHRQL